MVRVFSGGLTFSSDEFDQACGIGVPTGFAYDQQ